MKTEKLILLGIISLCLAFITGCEGTSSSSGDTGTLSLYMTDSTTDAFDAVYVTIDEVQVHMAEDDETDDNGRDGNEEENGSWKVVASPNTTYNLLELVNGAMAKLGTTELETGHYTQMRLMLGNTPDDGENVNGQPHDYANYVIKKDSNTQEPLFVPSGYQTGIKLVHGFDIVAGQTAELLLDFDANRSVVVAGAAQSGHEYLLKPTIKILDTVDYPLVKGKVMDEDENGLAEVVVSAQTVDSDGKPKVFTSTLSSGQDGEIGYYQMYLPEDNYYIVAYKGKGDDLNADEAYGPSCTKVEAIGLGAVYGEENLYPGRSNTGEILVDLILPDGSDEDPSTATIHVLKTAPCADPNTNEMIEVVSKSFASGPHSLSVPGSEDGTEYTMVATSDGNTIEEKVTVHDGETTDITFDSNENN